MIAGGLTWAFRRLNKANALLADRTKDLLRANHELTLAAKTSALGAVTAHLIHGLKNPLFGLQAFVSGELGERGEKQWQAAVDTTKRMQAMIADVVRILHEEQGERSYEISIPELTQILEKKIAPMSTENGVPFSVHSSATGALHNREANLVILALTNLIQNAMQAAKKENRVRLEIVEAKGAVNFEVSDQAGGMPPSALKNLFLPTNSSKAGGTGLGLAITKQLANHMGGQLELVETNEIGTTFRLALPRALFVAEIRAEEKSQSARTLA